MMETETLFPEDGALWGCGQEDLFDSSSGMGGLSPFHVLEPLPPPPPIQLNSFSKERSGGGPIPDLCSTTGDLLLFKGSPGGNLTPPMPYPPNSAYPPPSQQLLSPNGYSPPNYCLDQGTNGNAFSPFPASMSLNVSMNMTMGYIPDQMGWSGPPSSAASQPGPSSYLCPPPNYGSPPPPPNFCSQPYSATYSFAADFRPTPPSLMDEERLRQQWHTHSSPSPHHQALTPCLGSSTPNNKRQKSSRSSSENLSPTFGPLSKCNLCRICGKTYARPSTLKTHLRTHSGEKPYRCGECNKSFSQAANLTAHVRTHSGEKPFQCPICDRRFSQSSSVTTHMRTHSGERPYRCRLCKKAFSDSSTLTKHLRIHSGEKPYQCKLCLLRFSQSGNLNRHMRVHSGGP